MKKQLTSIVRQVVIDYLKEKNQSEKKMLFVLLDYPSYFSEKLIWDSLKKISMTKYEMILCVNDNWRNVPGDLNYKKLIHLDELTIEDIRFYVNQAKTLIIPTITFGFVSKLASLIDDEKSVFIALQFLLRGKNVIVATDNIEIKGINKMFAPTSIHDRLRSYLRKIRKDGVFLVKIDHLINLMYGKKLKNSKRLVILEEHVKELFYEGKNELYVPINTVITPLGKDLAKQLGISIYKTRNDDIDDY